MTKYIIAICLFFACNASAATRVLHRQYENVDLTDKINREIKALEKQKFKILDVKLQEVIVNFQDGYLFDYASVLYVYEVHKHRDCQNL